MCDRRVGCNHEVEVHYHCRRIHERAASSVEVAKFDNWHATADCGQLVSIGLLLQCEEPYSGYSRKRYELIQRDVTLPAGAALGASSPIDSYAEAFNVSEFFTPFGNPAWVGK